MKKLLALAVTLLMTLCILVSCGGNKDNNDLNDDNKEQNENSENSAYVPKVESTEGLAFSLNPDNKSYTLTGIGICTATDIIIDGHNGLPV